MNAQNTLWLIILTACSTGSATPTADALAPWPQDPVALLARCDQEAFAELATTCRVQAAARFGATGDSERAHAVCAEVPEGTWREECHFRAGEELGHAGQAIAGLEHCAAAGRFGRNCLTHTAWRMPRIPGLHAGLSPARVQAAFDELDGQATRALDGADDGVQGEGRDVLRARFAWNVYVGGGHPDPAAAKLPDPLGPPLRTGFAVEVVRLQADTATVESIRAVYEGGRAIPEGDKLDTTDPLGRFSLPLVAPAEHAIPHTPTFGGGLRLVGATPDEDLTIAALEALFWLESTPADTFVPYLDDPAERVRWTAAKLLGRAPPREVDLPALLQSVSTTHADATVRWHTTKALEQRAWEGPGTRRPG